MTLNAADPGFTALAALARALGGAALAVGAVLALMFAFAAALVVGLMVAGAALALRIWPRHGARDNSAAPVLDARRTPSGWVVETSGRKV